MAYYCQFNGTGYLTAATLGNLLTASRIRVVIKRLRVVGDGFIFSQSGAGSTREFGVLYSGGSLNYIYGSSTERAILTTAETSSNFGSGGYFDLTFDNTAKTVVLRNDVGGTIKSVSLVKGVSRIDGMLFRLGARCGNDTTDTSGGFIATNGTWIGDVDIYINDVLVRNYITPSTGTTIPDPVGGNDLTQRGTWPAGDGEWIFYSSGGATYSGGAATSYALDSTGGGLSLRLGGAVTTYTIDTLGGGTRTTSSGAATSYALDSTGGGTRTTSAGAVTTYTIDTLGGGDVIKGATASPGGAAVTFAAESTGGGVVIRSGGALLNFTAETTGGATRTTTGGGAVTVSLITVGGGDVLGPGYKPTITAPAVAVRRTYTGQGVRVVKTYRAPYTVATQKTFRGPTCRL